MKRLFIMLLSCGFLVLTGCKKNWLDIKNDKKIIVPTTLKDMRLLLNNTTVFLISYVGIGEISSDNMNAQSSHLASASNTQQNAYQWASDVFNSPSAVSEWNVCYNQIFTSNVVLEGLEKIADGKGDAEEWNDVRGAALFFRSKALFDLATLFAAPYNNATAQQELGIPLRLTSDIATPVTRSSLMDTYQQILKDLNEAKTLLRNKNAYPSDANKCAALGLLARVYLAMGNFGEALKCADAFLAINQTLIDFNTINTGAARPFAIFNPETVFYSTLVNYNLFTNAYISSDLIASYQQDDLRLAAFFKTTGNGFYTFKGNYSGSVIPFSGFTPAEMLLVRAECNARNNKLELALDDVEILLKKRYKTNSYVRPQLADGNAVLNYVLTERRKELVFRGQRWPDLRRFSKEPNLAIAIRHVVGSSTYELLPDSKRYTYAIPEYIIGFSNIQQNPR